MSGAPVGVGCTGLRREGCAVDDVAPVAGQAHAVYRLEVAAARFGELPSHAPNLRPQEEL